MGTDGISKNEGRAASVITNYLKRWAEGAYTDLIDNTSLGKKLKGLGIGKKLSLEAALYGFSTILDEKLPENSPLKKIFKNMVSDMPPEIAKRVINGDFSSEEKKLFLIEGSGDDLKDSLETDVESLNAVLGWIETLEENEKEEALEKISDFSSEEMKNFSLLDPGAKKLFLKMVKKKKTFGDKFSDWWEKEVADLKEYRANRDRR